MNPHYGVFRDDDEGLDDAEADAASEPESDASEPDETLVPRDRRDRQPGRRPSGHGIDGGAVQRSMKCP